MFLPRRLNRLYEMNHNHFHRPSFPLFAHLILMKEDAPVKKGLSLLECLLSLSLFFLIFIGSIEFFGISRNVFLRLSTEEKTEEAVSFALDRIRIDLLDSGRGLSDAMKLGLTEGIKENEKGLTIYSKERGYSLASDLFSGQERIDLQTSSNIKKGREICIYDSEKGEKKSIAWKE